MLSHPSLITNSRGYAFFVAGSAVFPNDIICDSFSQCFPSSYKTKVTMFAVMLDIDVRQFLVKEDANYRMYPYALIRLDSWSYKQPRIQKQIYCMIERQSREVLGHALILYEYTYSGQVPRLCAPHYLPITARDCDTINGMQSEMSNHRKPFKLPLEVAVDGTFYMQLDDLTFWNDCNRQLYYLVNRSDLIEEFGCMNSKVPILPPFTTAKGAFVFFVSGEQVDFRLLMTDDLGPWDENTLSKPDETTGRSRVPLIHTCQSQLRVVTENDQLLEPMAFKLKSCTALSSRCSRLLKKVVYVERNGSNLDME